MAEVTRLGATEPEFARKALEACIELLERRGDRVVGCFIIVFGKDEEGGYTDAYNASVPNDTMVLGALEYRKARLIELMHESRLDEL